MATLQAIRDGIKATLEGAIPSLHVYDTVPDTASILPAVVVMPTDANFNVAFGRGTDEWNFDLLVLTSYGEASIGQDTLDDLVCGSGVSSIRRVIFENRSLGLSETDANISGMTNYGTTMASGGVDHIGATLRLYVVTSGKE